MNERTIQPRSPRDPQGFSRRGVVALASLQLLAASGCAKAPAPAAPTPAASVPAASPANTVTQTATGGTLDRPVTVRVEKPAPLVERSNETPITHRGGIKPAVAGSLPLVYLLESGSVVTVVEAQSRASLVSLPLAGPTIVRVDARRGVVAGQRVVRPGPLDDTRQYEIYVGDESADFFRTRAYGPAGEN